MSECFGERKIQLILQCLLLALPTEIADTDIHTFVSGARTTKAHTKMKVILIQEKVRVNQMLKVGDKVVMNNKYRILEQYRGRVFTVRSEPKMICGTICVFLENYKGCYAADGLDKAED